MMAEPKKNGLVFSPLGGDVHQKTTRNQEMLLFFFFGGVGTRTKKFMTTSNFARFSGRW